LVNWPDPGLCFDDDGDILMDDTFLRWCKEEGISIDWLACGDPKGMAVRFREVQQGRNEMTPHISQLDEEELGMLTFAIRTYVKNAVPLDQALKAFETCVEDYRREAKVA
jgi:hypothetical protein